MQIKIQDKDAVTRIVLEAAKLLKKYQEKGFTSRSKGGVDFATEADDAIDLFLREELTNNFPKTNFLTEETAPPDYSSLKDAENLWVIDPIDGTTDFARGGNQFSISVAFVQKGLTQLGVVYLPEQDRLYLASEGEDGVFCNGKNVQVSKVSKLSESLVCTGWSWNLADREKTYALLGKIITKVRASQVRGSAAADMASVASGTIDAYFLYGIKPWDIAASSLFLQKAGGRITRISGAEWNIFDSDFLASNNFIHQDLLTLFQG